MSGIKRISKEDISSLSGRSAGLITGPRASLNVDIDKLNDSISREFDVPKEASFLETADSALDNGAEPEKIRLLVQEWISAAPARRNLARLVSCRWSAVLSLSLDLQFEEMFKANQHSSPVPKDVSVIADLVSTPTANSIPIFKLLGHIKSQDFTISRTGAEERLLMLNRAVRRFTDDARDAVLCIGHANSENFLLERVVTALASEHVRTPKGLVFIAGEEPSNLQRIARLSRGRVRIFIADCSRSDIIKALSPRSAAQQTLLSFANSDDPTAVFAPYSDLVELVNRHKRSAIGKTEKNRLKDILFSPSKPRWDAFVHNLDFRRSQEGELVTDIKSLSLGGEGGVILLVGGVATGKTTLLKRVALEAARGEAPIFWMKRYDFADREEQLEKLFRAVSTHVKSKHAVMFIDDPSDLGIYPSKVNELASRVGIRALIVAASRRTDVDMIGVGVIAGKTLKWRIDIDDELDDDEWARLPDYIYAMDIARSRDEALAIVRRAESKNARDTLAILFFLLGDAQGSIRDAIREEYYRLGNSAALSRAIGDRIRAAPGILQKAYEFIAASESFGAPVPVEVLVSALDLSYGEWVDALGDSGNALGLFYSEDDEISESFSYRTRNWVVRETITRLINLGSESNRGSVRLIEQLLSACGGTHPAYREFAVRVLVPSKKLKQLDIDYMSGLSLYAAAQSALPFPDKTIKHHEALWARDNEDFQGALGVLGTALDTPNYPNATHSEMDEHIHTSVASVLLDMLDADDISLEDCKHRCLEEYRRATSEKVWNTHAVHTFARLMWRIAERGSDDQLGDTSVLLDRALGDLDKAISAVSRPGQRASSLRTDKDLEMLVDQQSRICVSIGNLEVFKDKAEALYKASGNQEGLAVLVRALSFSANREDKGRLYKEAFDSFLWARDLVEGGGGRLQSALAECGLLLYYNWQVQRRYLREPSSGDSPPKWDVLLELADLAVREPRASASLSRYIYALAAWHSGKYSDATALFQRLRELSLSPRVLWQARDYALDQMGHVAPHQGTIRSGSSNSFFHLELLGVDVPAQRRERWPQGGQSIQAYIEFTFGGPRAVRTPSLSSSIWKRAD